MDSYEVLSQLAAIATQIQKEISVATQRDKIELSPSPDFGRRRVRLEIILDNFDAVKFSKLVADRVAPLMVKYNELRSMQFSVAAQDRIQNAIEHSASALPAGFN